MADQSVNVKEFFKSGKASLEFDLGALNLSPPQAQSAKTNKLKSPAKRRLQTPSPNIMALQGLQSSKRRKTMSAKTDGFVRTGSPTPAPTRARDTSAQMASQLLRGENVEASHRARESMGEAVQAEKVFREQRDEREKKEAEDMAKMKEEYGYGSDMEED